jgi:hypothetical protein
MPRKRWRYGAQAMGCIFLFSMPFALCLESEAPSIFDAAFTEHRGSEDSDIERSTSNIE